MHCTYGTLVLPKRQTLDEIGYPIHPDKLAIGIRRANLPSGETLTEALTKGYELPIAFRHMGEWRLMVGHVRILTHFTDGIVICYPQVVEKSALKWEEATLWMPYEGPCGILA